MNRSVLFVIFIFRHCIWVRSTWLRHKIFRSCGRSCNTPYQMAKAICATFIESAFSHLQILWRMREIVELSQRMDIKYDVFAFDTANEYLSPHYATPEGITTELYYRIFKEKISGDYDLIVSGISWKMLPLWARYEILKKVKNGANFLLYLRAPQDKDEYLERATTNPVKITEQFAFPYKGLPELEKYLSFNDFLAKRISGYSFGKGRIFIINTYTRGPGTMQLLTPVRTKSPLEADYIEYDYYLAFIIRTMLIAAGRDLECRIIGPDYVKEDYGKGINMVLSVESKNDRIIDFNFVVRKKSGQEILAGEKRVKLNTGKNNLGLNLDDIPAGFYYVDLWLKETGKLSILVVVIWKFYPNRELKRLILQRVSKRKTL